MSRLLRAIASNYVVLAVQAAYLAVLTPLIIAHDDAQTYGRWTLILAVVAYLRLLDLGLGPTTARFVAAGRGDDVSTAVSTSLAVLLAVAALGVIVAAVLGVASLQGGHGSTFELALSVAVASRATQLPLAVAGYVLYGLDRIVHRNVFASLRSGLSLIATVVAIFAGASLVVFVLAGACAEILVSVAQAVFLKATAPQVRISPRRVNLAQLRITARFTGGLLVLSLTSLVIVNSDTIVVGLFLGSGTVAVYAIAMRLIEGATMLLTQISDVFLPAFSRAHGRGDDGSSREMVRVATLATTGLAFALAGLFASFGDRLIRLWVGPGFANSWIPLLLLSAGLVFNAPLRFAVLWAIAGDRHRRLTRLAVTEALVNVALTVALVFPFGIRGVAAASSVTFAVWNGWLIPRVVFPLLGLDWVRDFLWPLLLSAAAALLPAFALRAALVSTTLGPVALVAASLVWFLALSLGLGMLLLRAPDRRAMWRALGRGPHGS